jgi:hypothetical protein
VEEGQILSLFLSWGTHPLLPSEVGAVGSGTFWNLYQYPIPLYHQNFELRLSHITSFPVFQIVGDLSWNVLVSIIT